MNIFDFFRRKSLTDLHPEVLEREHLFSINSEDAPTVTGTSYGQAVAAYTNYMWLQKAIGKVADNIAPLPLIVARGSGNDTEYMDAHPIQALLDNPNPEQGSAELAREWAVNMFLGGEVGFEAVWNKSKRQILELWPRQSEEYTVRPESARYRRVAYYRVDDGHGDPYTLMPDQMCQFKFYNPLSPFRGLSPVNAVKYSIIIDQLAQVWSRLFFKNQARPDFAVVAPEGITKTERDEILKTLTDNYSSGDGIHKPIVLENGVTDIKTFSFPAKDTEWLNQRQMSRDEVAAIVGVPDEIMGYGRDTYENFDTAERVLWTLTIVPLAGLRDGTLTRFFRRVGLLKANERVITDMRGVPQLQEDKTAKIANAKELWSMGVPLNTASEYLNMGLPTVEGGDIGFLPMGVSPIMDVINPPEPAPAPEPVAEPAPELDTPEDDTDEEDLPAEDAAPAAGKSWSKAVGVYGSDEHVAEYKRLQARLDRPVDALKRIVKREFQRQQNEIGAALRAGKQFGRGLYKDSIENIPDPQSLFDLQKEIRKFIDAFESEVSETVGEVGKDELAKLGISVSFDITRPEVKAAIRTLLETVATKTNNTTWTALVELFEEAEAAGEGIPAIQERLSAYFGDRKSDYQTERIARSTMNSASNAGSQRAWEQAEGDGVALVKEWISALEPDRTREAHAEAHGQVVGLHELFTVDGESLEYPGDPNGSPGNVINCLCSMIAVVQE